MVCGFVFLDCFQGNGVYVRSTARESLDVRLRGEDRVCIQYTYVDVWLSKIRVDCVQFLARDEAVVQIGR